jgi:hypothetical protein
VLFIGTQFSILYTFRLSPDDMHDADAVQALYEAAQPYMPATVASDTNDCDTQPVFEGSVEDSSLTTSF